MTRARQVAKIWINHLLRGMRVRIVNSSWGPRGFVDAFLRAKQQGLSASHIVDAGAFNGSWTRDCLDVFPDARYFLVDPLEENETSLKKMARSNPKITVWSGALGPESGQLELYLHADQSSFLESEYMQSGDDATKVVKVRTLDSFLEDGTISTPDIIKADVQGFEIEVLRGAEKCLESTELVLLEVSYRRIYEDSPLAHEVISYIGSKGFRIFDICTYAQRPYDGQLAQSDILFAKDTSILFKHEGWSAV